MSQSLREHHISIEGARAALARARPTPFVELLRHGTLQVEFFAPRGVDTQQPHRQDELYVVAKGSGEFVRAEERVRFAAGAVLFVPAGVPHRFENFTGDLELWVFFYGPDGGEAGR